MDDMERAGFGVGWGVALVILTDQQLTGTWMRENYIVWGAWKNGMVGRVEDVSGEHGSGPIGSLLPGHAPS